MQPSFNNNFLYAAGLLRTEFQDRHSTAVRSGYGTCALVRDDDRISIVTARHNVDLEYEARHRFHELSASRFQLLCCEHGSSTPTVAAVVNVPPDTWVFHPDGSVDLATAHLGPELRLESGRRDLAFNSFVPRSMFATQADFDEVLEAGEVVCFPGYPEWHDRAQERPILRIGTIISDPRFDHRLASGPPTPTDGAGRFAIEALSQSGNSGGPVFVQQRGLAPGGDIVSLPHHPVLFVGVDVGHLNNPVGGHSGLSFVHRAPLVSELLDL